MPDFTISVGGVPREIIARDEAEATAMREMIEGLGGRIAYALFRAGVVGRERLAACHDDDLLSVHGIGPQSLRRIREWLMSPQERADRLVEVYHYTRSRWHPGDTRMVHDEHVLVCTVDTEVETTDPYQHLDAAFRLTNSIDAPWWRNPQVHLVKTEAEWRAWYDGLSAAELGKRAAGADIPDALAHPLHSTSVDDELVYKGVRYRCMPFGWQERVEVDKQEEVIDMNAYNREGEVLYQRLMATQPEARVDWLFRISNHERLMMLAYVASLPVILDDDLSKTVAETVDTIEAVQQEVYGGAIAVWSVRIGDGHKYLGCLLDEQFQQIPGSTVWNYLDTVPEVIQRLKGIAQEYAARKGASKEV